MKHRAKHHVFETKDDNGHLVDIKVSSDMYSDTAPRPWDVKARNRKRAKQAEKSRRRNRG